MAKRRRIGRARWLDCWVAHDWAGVSIWVGARPVLKTKGPYAPCFVSDAALIRGMRTEISERVELFLRGFSNDYFRRTWGEAAIPPEGECWGMILEL